MSTRGHLPWHLPTAAVRAVHHACTAQVVYSGGRDVDLLAAGAGKGRALAFLLGKMAKAGCAPTEGVQVRGGL